MLKKCAQTPNVAPSQRGIFERVLAELTELSERYGIRSIQFVDNILDMSYFKTLLPMLADARNGYTLFYANQELVVCLRGHSTDHGVSFAAEVKPHWKTIRSKNAISESDKIQGCSHQGLPRPQHLRSQACLNDHR